MNCIAASECPVSASASGGELSRSAEDKNRLFTPDSCGAVYWEEEEELTTVAGRRSDIGAVVA